MLVAVLDATLQKTIRPIYIQGFPGVAKSAAVKQFATRNGLGYAEHRFGLSSPSEVGGISVPDFDTKRVERFMSEVIAKCWKSHGGTDGKATLRVVLMLDEMDKAGKMLQNAALELTHDYSMAGHLLPPGTIIVLGGNVTADGSGSYATSTALANRCTFVVFEGPTAPEWTAYADPSPEVAQLVRANPMLLKPAKSESFSAKREVNTTPRSLEGASLYMSEHGDPEMLSILLHGTIHGPDASTLMDLRQMAGRLYPFEAILNGTAKAFEGRDRMALSVMQARGVSRALRMHIDNATTEASADGAIVAVSEYVSSILPGDINAWALADVQNALIRSNDGVAVASMPNTRVLTAYKNTDIDPAAFIALRDRVENATLGG